MFKFSKVDREILLYCTIASRDFGESYAGQNEMAEALEAIGPGEITVKINSPGGAVDECFGMIAILSRHNGPKKIVVDGLAASAASLFLCNPKWRREIAETAIVMIHEPRSGAFGTAADLESAAEGLRVYCDRLVASYKSVVASASESQLRKWMQAETYFSAAESVEIGFCDAVIESPQPTKRTAGAKKSESRRERLNRVIKEYSNSQVRFDRRSIAAKRNKLLRLRFETRFGK